VRDFPLLWALLPLVALLLVAAWVIARVRRWREEDDRATLSPGDELTRYRELYEQGELEEEEYQRIRALLGQRLKHQLNLPPEQPGEPSKPQGDDTPPETEHRTSGSK
jgi:hypothetical protein